jgi:peroxiredoxin
VVDLVLLCLPLIALYGLLVLPELPGLWGHLVLWLFFAVFGWLGFREPQGPSRTAIVAFGLMAAFGCWYAVAYIPGEISRTLSQLRDEPAPEFALVTLQGEALAPESLEGRVVVLDFFATWCAPCVAELPEIDAIYRRYSGTPEVEVLVVANDSGGDTPEAILGFIDGRDLDVPFVYDPEGRAHRAFGFVGLPGLVVIDRAGRIRFTREGYNAAEGGFQKTLIEIVETTRAAAKPAQGS